MADLLEEEEKKAADLLEEEERNVRGRPRLTDSDRTRRRLESRKKYDCRRVYLGEAHGAWVQRRDAEGQGEPWSDAKLATHLLALERQGKACEDDLTLEHHDKRRRHRVNSLQSLMTWFQDHMSQCLHEPRLSELDTNHALYITAVWQCQAGHHFFQDLQCPVKKLNHHGIEENPDSNDSSSSSSLEEPPLDPCSPSEQNVDTLYSNSVKNEILCTDEESETMVCVPMGPETEELFQGVTQETLGHVVATSCPSQVIIIAGPGYEGLAAEGIQLSVTEGSIGEDGTYTTLDAVTAYTRTEVMDQDLEQQIAVTEDNTLYCLQRLGPEGEGEFDGDNVQGQAEPVSTLVHECSTNTTQNKATGECEQEIMRKSNRCQALDGDGELQMFHCPYEGCSQVYTALNSLQNHMNLVHRKGKTKVCPEPGCEKSFYLSNHLRRHMITHTGVREFICEICGKSFKRKSHLEVHKRTHTGETPLQCEVCGFQCKQRASLNWHMKKHQAELQYSFFCEHCGKPFEKQESVKFHKLKSHPDLTTT